MVRLQSCFGNQSEDKSIEMENAKSPEKDALSSNSSKKIVFLNCLGACVYFHLQERSKYTIEKRKKDINKIKAILDRLGN